MPSLPPPSELERTIERVGQQLLDTWRDPDPSRRFDTTLREALITLTELFPTVLYSATIYINSSTELYRGKTVGPLDRVIQTNTSHPQGAAAYIMRSQQYFFVEDVAAWPSELPKLPEHLWQAQPIAAYVGMPLVIGATGQEEVVGTLLIVLAEPQHFSEPRCQTLRLFARQVAIVVQNARVLRRRRREEDAFRLIADLASSGDPDEVASTIARQVRELTKTAYVAVLLIDPHSGHLNSRGVSVYGDETRTGMIALDLDRKSMNSHVVWTRQAYYAPNINLDPYHLRYSGWDEQMQSAYCVPLVAQPGVIGTIYVTSTELDGIGEDDRRFLDHLAPYAALALHYASQMAEERRQRVLSEDRVDLLSRIKRFQEGIAKTLSVAEQMRQIRLMFAAQDINTDGFFVATYDEATNLIVLPNIIERGVEVQPTEKQPGMKFAVRRLGEKRGLVDYVLRTRATLLVHDCATWADRQEIEPSFLEQIKCCLITPLWRAGKIIGVIGLRGYEHTYMYTQLDQELLEGVSSEIAIVIENAYRYEALLAQLNLRNEELKQRVQELRAVSDFQRRISSIDLEEGEALRSTNIIDFPSGQQETSVEEREIQGIYDEAVNVLRAVGLNTSNMYVALYDESTQLLTFPLVYEAGQRVTDDPIFQQRRLGDQPHVGEWIIEHHQSLLFESHQQMADWAATQPRTYRLPKQSHSWLAAPMLFKGRAIGMLVLRDMEQERAFTPGHRDLLEIAANQAAIAIENARLYERARRHSHQLRALFEAGRSLAGAGFDLQTVLHTILEQAMQVTGAHFASIHRLEGQLLKLLEVWPASLRDKVAAQVGEAPLAGPGISTLAVRENHYQLVPDVTKHPAYLDLTGETGAELAVVLQRNSDKGEQTPLGVLNVEHRQVGGLDREAAGILIAFSNLAAVALHNAQQYNELQEVRERTYMSYAVAHMGLYGANWRHTIHQYTFSLSHYLAGIHDLLGAAQIQPEIEQQISQALHDMSQIIAQIGQTPWPELPEENTPLVGAAIQIDEALRSYITGICADKTNLQVEYRLQCADEYVRISHESLQMALEKLVNNALAAMPNGGRLTVETRRQGSFVHVYLTDTGVGIPAAIRPDFLKRPIPRLAYAPRTGSGAGALIARFIALNHDGDLSLVNTAPGQGTTLLLKLRSVER